MEKKKTTQNYSNAFLELQKIVADIQDDNLMLDELADKIKQAKELIQFCENSLRKIEDDLEKI
ncbi:MAG: exodeoxyribonuclease VII small subunit [Chitinophagaceae bacterium]|jgi:exodeoxyribonuclease VII small subunit|nr:exodeoxyribonuclease VII small subunit [Chitinophagaceae bacterium]